MKINTNISNVIDGNADKSRYDAEIKKLFSDQTILAWIMQYTIREFAGYSVEDIRECIEGEPEVASRKVTPGHTRLHGLLSILLSGGLKPGEKKEILEQEYGIATSVEVEGGLQRMCNLSELIEEKGVKKGIQKGALITLLELVNDGILSEEAAAGRLGLSVDAFKEAEKGFKEM